MFGGFAGIQFKYRQRERKKQQPQKQIKMSTLKPIGKHTASVIWLHGLGDQGSSWAPAFQQLHKEMKSVKFIFPDAPVQKVTLNMGMRVHARIQFDNLDSA